MGDFSAAITSVRQLAVSLRDARQNAGLSQTELAQAANIPRPWINQLEQGKIADPGLHRVLSICHALHTTLTIAYPLQPQEQAQTAKPSQAVSADTETSDTDKISRLRSASLEMTVNSSCHFDRGDSRVEKSFFSETSKQPDTTQEAACSPGDSIIENFMLDKVNQSLFEDLTRMATAFDEQAAALNGKSHDKEEAQ